VPRARRGSVAGLSPSAKNVAALFMRREEKLSEEQKEYLGRLCSADEALADGDRLKKRQDEVWENLKENQGLAVELHAPSGTIIRIARIDEYSDSN